MEIFCTSFSFRSWMRQWCIFFTNCLTVISSWEQTDLNNPTAMRKLHTHLHIKYRSYSRAAFWPLEQSPLQTAFFKLEQNRVQQSLCRARILSSLLLRLHTYWISTIAASAHPQHTNGAHFWQWVISRKQELLPLLWFQRKPPRSQRLIHSQIHSQAGQLAIHGELWGRAVSIHIL